MVDLEERHGMIVMLSQMPQAVVVGGAPSRAALCQQRVIYCCQVIPLSADMTHVTTCATHAVRYVDVHPFMHGI